MVYYARSDLVLETRGGLRRWGDGTVNISPGPRGICGGSCVGILSRDWGTRGRNVAGWWHSGAGVGAGGGQHVGWVRLVGVGPGTVNPVIVAASVVGCTYSLDSGTRRRAETHHIYCLAAARRNGTPAVLLGCPRRLRRGQEGVVVAHCYTRPQTPKFPPACARKSAAPTASLPATRLRRAPAQHGGS